MDEALQNLSKGLKQEDVNTYMELIMKYGVDVISALLILVAGWIIGGWVARRIRNSKRIDQTLSSFLANFARYTILAMTFIVVLGQFGVQTASLIAVLGAAGLAIGLALQGTLSNVAAGVMMLILRPFSVGDYIEAGGVGGTVKNLGLFGSEMATPDNVYIFMPNSKLWGSDIKNYSRNQHRRQDFVLGITYDDDIDKAMKVIQKIVDKEDRLIRTEGKEPQIMLSSMGDSSINITVRVWSLGSDFWPVKWGLNKTFKQTFDKEGISFPFPTRTIEIVSNENVAAATKPKKTKKAA